MKSIQEYEAFLSAIRKETGIEMLTPDETGLVTVSVDGAYNLNLQYVEATGAVLCFVEVMQLQKDAPKSVYRDLLVGALFGKDTAGGYFTLEDESETVVYNYFFDGERAAQSPEEFVATLEKILQLCDLWVDRINSLVNHQKENPKENSLFPLNQNKTFIRP